jgi:mannose-6-phosphate isomerase-like protein (cupin superfamily)
MLHSLIVASRGRIGEWVSGRCRADNGAVTQGEFDTMQLPGVPDVVAPDGSDVRVLLSLGRGSMAHFELGAGRVSRPVAHHSVDEIWFILHGHGQMWRRQAERQEIVPLRSGTCVSIPAGTHFQFRSDSGGPLAAVGVTMPPWPGADEAYDVPGAWPARPAPSR